jgi:ketosteroid isomerase-like protein
MTNLETVQTFYAGAAAGDLERIRSILAPELAWRQTPGFPNAQTFRSPDEVLSGVFGRLHEEWDGFKGVPEEFIDGGERIVVLGTYSGTSRATGRSFEAPFAHVFTVADGAIVEMRQYADSKLVHDAWRD